MEKYNGWTKAAQDVGVAMAGLLSCLNAGNNAWLEVQKNGEQSFPIIIPNPELDNPHNWTMAYGIQRDEKKIETQRFLNSTERDLTVNWTYTFADSQGHVDAYIQRREVTEGSIASGGIGYAMRVEDWNAYMERTGQPGRIDARKFWVTMWKAKPGIEVWVPDPSIKSVFVVCYNKQPVDLAHALKKAGDFLTVVGAMVERGELQL